MLLKYIGVSKRGAGWSVLTRSGGWRNSMQYLKGRITYIGGNINFYMMLFKTKLNFNNNIL